MRALIRRVATWLSGGRLGPEAARGAAIAVAITGLAGAVLFELSAGFGLPRPLDLLVVLGCAAGTMALCGAIGEWLLKLVRRSPHRLSGFVLGAALIWAVLFVAAPSPLLLGLVVVVPQALLGAALGTAVSSGLRTAPLARKASAAGWLIVALALDLALFAHARSRGDARPVAASSLRGAVAAVGAPDPAQRGPFPVRTLTYGSGSDRRRLEFGASVELRTSSVDGSHLLRNEPAMRGFSGGYRKWYWGFDATALPINGRVFYPSGDGPFPLVLIVHGNALMTTPSDTGYGYLGELLASRGFIVVSVDENFLNLGITADTTGEAAARGWMLLEHLKVWRDWNGQPGNPFNARVDLSRIALIGHSRGGEAVATAAILNQQRRWSDDATVSFDYGFAIRALAAIAPVDFGYAPSGSRSKKTLSGVDYLVIQGGQDVQMPVFAGSRQYNRTRVAGEPNRFKAEIYIDGANHAQFNTSWGRADFPMPISWLLVDRPVLPGEAQRDIASTYISAFLEASLRGRHEYLPLLVDPRAGRAWLPDTPLRQRFQDATFRLVAGFDEDTDVVTTTVPGGRAEARELATWREGPVAFRLWTDRQDNAVYLKGIPSAGSYTVTLPEGGAAALKIAPASSLQLSLALTATAPSGTERCDPAFELTDEAGVTAGLPLSQFGALPPPPVGRYYKWKHLDAVMGHAPEEIVPQTFTLPLSAFVVASPAFQPARLRSIRLRLDGCPGSEILVDELGFSG